MEIKDIHGNLILKVIKKNIIILVEMQKNYIIKLLLTETCLYDLNKKDITLIIKAFYKVWNNLGFNLTK